MGDLSLNPSSWSLSNLAEEAAEFITGSEAAGDLVGLAVAYGTGDIGGVVSQAGDLGTNIVAGGKALVEGYIKAGQNAGQEFSNPGSVKSPSQGGATAPGYAEGTPASQNDTGVVGNAPASQTGAADEAKGLDPELQKEYNELQGVLSDLNMSLEDKVFALLMFLNKKKEGDVEKTVNKMAAKEGKGEKLTSKETFELQKSQSDLSQLNNLTTTMMQSFKQMKDSVIQNIGR